MRTILFLAALFLCAFLEATQGFGAPVSSVNGHVPGTAVEMPYLVAPVAVDGKLVAYAYVSTRIIAASPSAAIDVRAKTPFIQDAYVRDVNRSPVSDGSYPPKIDASKLVRRLSGAAKRIVGGDKVSEVELLKIQLSQLRPDPRS